MAQTQIILNFTQKVARQCRQTWQAGESTNILSGGLSSGNQTWQWTMDHL